MKDYRDIAKEFRELEIIVEYNCEAILMNAHNGNYTLKEIIDTTTNKSTAELAKKALEINSLYEKSYSIVGAQDFCDLRKSGLDAKYNILQSEYRNLLDKAKNSILDLCIKKNVCEYIEVYERVVKKYNNLLKKVQKSSTTSGVDECNLHNYKLMIDNYNNSSFQKTKLFYF